MQRTNWNIICADTIATMPRAILRMVAMRMVAMRKGSVKGGKWFRSAGGGAGGVEFKT